MTVYTLGQSSAPLSRLGREQDLLVFTDGMNWDHVDLELAKLKSFCWSVCNKLRVMSEYVR